MHNMEGGDMGWQAAGKGGAVAAGKQESVDAGISILEAGGNAADAAVATILALSITDYGLFAIGGEVPFMIYDAKAGETKVLNGLGGAPSDPDAIAWYYENGIPSDGHIKAAPVPGAVALCLDALRMYGTMSFETVVQPALRLLETAERDWYPKLAATFGKLLQAEAAASGGREAGIQAAYDCFYRGEVADDLEAWYIEGGSFLRKADLDLHTTRIEDPVCVEYRGYTVCKCGPWTQGPSLLQALRLLEGFDLRDMGHLSADTIHVTAEALKLAFADRDEYYTDPQFGDVPMDALLSDEYTELRRPLIDMTAASAERRPGDPYTMQAVKTPGPDEPWGEGTTTCCVVDRWGNFVSATPSCNAPAGGGTTGVAHGNRLRCMNTNPKHPNHILARKRPRITLTPTLVLRDGKPVATISVAGGDLQDQTALNIFLNVVEWGMAPAEAVTTSRFSTSHHENSFSPVPNRVEAITRLQDLCLHAGIDDATKADLEGRGHVVRVTEGAIAVPVMIWLDDDGTMRAAGDHRAGRHADAIA